ncbi:MAG: TIGR03790 family protein [Fimbriimonadales bacterium]
MLVLVAASAFVVAGNPYVDRTLVVLNTDSPTSLAVGADYMRKRGVPAKLLVHCQDSAESAAKETIPYPAFRDEIESPLRVYLSKHPKIDFIVLTKGIPIRITGAPGLGVSSTQPSLDSFVAALDYGSFKGAIKVTLTDTGFSGTAWANRFWNSTERFSHAKFGGYLVTRLDGYTEDQARLLVAWSLASEKQPPAGEILLDSCPSFGYADARSQPMSIFTGTPDPAVGVKSVNELPYNTYNGDMVRASELLGARKIPFALEKTDAFVAGSDLMGYCSWGSNDSHFTPANYGKLRFAPGGIAETAVSTSARTFLPTTGGQSLIADLVAQRVSGVKGYCDEPLLQAIASPSILFDRYTRGWTLAESFYAASRFVGWEDIVVGDPICQPYGR